MRKSTLFISAVLTAFVMAMLAGVASAYQGVLSNKQSAVAQPKAQVQPQTNSVADAVPAEAKVETVNLTPQEAAGLAAKVLGHDDLFSVEATDLNGETVYMVTFTSGDLVYVSLDGQIRSIGKVQVKTVVANSGGGGGGRGRSDQNASQPPASNQSHVEQDDHENQGNHQEQGQYVEHED